MRCQQLSMRIFLSVIWGLLFLSQIGCQTFNAELSSMFGEEPPVAAAAPAANSDGPKYYVEFREDGRKPVLTAYPLSDVTLVQQALDESRAFDRFRRAKIEIFRQLPGGGGHKLPVEYDRAQDRVPPSTDYALHPNDRIVITEDRSTVLDDMLQSLGGPAKQLAGK